MKVTDIFYIKGYYIATDPIGKVLFGGEDNFGGVDGTDPVAVVTAAIKNSDVIHARLLEIHRKEK